MDHQWIVEGFGFRLRPVRIDDAAFIVELRKDAERCRFVNPISPRVADQEEWLRLYFARAGDYYFIVENAFTRQAEGTISVYDVSVQDESAEVGRMVLRVGSSAAHASLLLAWQFAIEMLGLKVFHCRTVEDNRPMLSFLNYFKTLGLEENGLARQQVNIRGTTHRLVEHQMTRATWQQYRDKLHARVTTLTRLMRGS